MKNFWSFTQTSRIHYPKSDVMRGNKAKSGACASDVLRYKTFVGHAVKGDFPISRAHIKGSGCQGVHNGEKS